MIITFSLIIIMFLVAYSIRNFGQKEDRLIRTSTYPGCVTKSWDNELILTELGNVKYKVYHTDNCFPNKRAAEGALLTIRKNVIKSGLTGQEIEEYKIESYNDNDEYESKDGFIINMIKI